MFLLLSLTNSSPSLILARVKHLSSGITPEEAGKKAINKFNKEGMNQQLMADSSKNSTNYAARSLTKDPNLEQLDEATIGGPGFGKVIPLPKKPSGALVEARNEKNAVLKDHEDIPSAHDKLKNNPTRVAKIGQKVLRDDNEQNNQNGDGVT